MKEKIVCGKHEYIIYNEQGDEISITEKQFQDLLNLKEKLEDLNLDLYDLENHLNLYKIDIAIKALVFVSKDSRRVVLLYRNEGDTLIDIIINFN